MPVYKVQRGSGNEEVDPYTHTHTHTHTNTHTHTHTHTSPAPTTVELGREEKGMKSRTIQKVPVPPKSQRQGYPGCPQHSKSEPSHGHSHIHSGTLTRTSIKTPSQIKRWPQSNPLAPIFYSVRAYRLLSFPRI